MITLDQTEINKIDLTWAEEMSGREGLPHPQNLVSPCGKEPYKLYAFLSKTFDDGVILDIGSHYGNSGLALSYNETNKVISYELTEHGASKLKKDNITWKFMDFRDDEELDWDNINMILIDVDPHDGVQEVEMIVFLREKGWKGILLLDDIHKDGLMEKFWSTFDEEERVDVTAVGHCSGTGLVEFE
jgi:predicted O-methyltransferase YrrM